MVDLPPDFWGNCTFNVDNLIPCRDTLDTYLNPFMDEPNHNLLSESPPLPPLSPKLFYAIENIDSNLVDQIVSSRAGGTRRCLVKLRERPESKNS